MPSPIIVTCPDCHSKNRLPADRLGDGGKCGQCKQPLFAARPVSLSSHHFNAHLQADLPLVVDFWAPWCGPCRQFAPTFERAAATLEPTARLAKVDTEAEPALAQRFNIRSIPTLIIFRQGQEQQRISGALSEQAFVQWVQQHIQ